MQGVTRSVTVIVLAAGLVAPAVVCAAAEGAKAPAEPLKDLPVVFEEDFEKPDALAKWEPMDPGQWKIGADGETKVLSLHKKGSKYRPKVRSPRNFALIKDLWLGDFVMDLKMKSTTKPYGHLDLCLFFGHQDATHFYYVHMAPRPDAHAHSIFAVDAKPRVSIVKERNKGIEWGRTWHNVRLVRKVADGTIEVYFDDMAKPIMTTQDKRFAFGRVGVGSFDDTGIYDDIRGTKVEPPKKDKPKTE